MRRNNFISEIKKLENHSNRNKPTTVLYLPNVLYSWGLKIAGTLGIEEIESYRNRIPASITDLNSEDKDFWKWARANNISVVKVGNLVDAQTLMRDGVAGVVSTTLDQFPIATEGAPFSIKRE